MTDPVQAHRAGGPAPLGLHLAQASAIVQGAAALAPVLHDPRAPWHRALSREAARLDAPRPECVLEVGMERLRETLRGIEMWQRHPWRRDLPEPPAVWSEGSTRLLDFGQVDGAPQPMGPPVLVIPSLINRADVLDLTRERSFLRALAQGGWRPLLLDWGAPGEDERGFALDDYIATRLRPALAAARVAGGRPCPVIGYCMGGTIAAGLAARFPADVSALVTLGAPWDFSAVSEPSERIAAALRQDGGLAARAAIRQMGLAFGAVPAVLFQTLFALLDFGLVFRKFRRFAALDQSSAEAKLFVALEDWLEDGVDLTPGVAETVLV
ncbi:MAG: alpha/beta fold hydrolase, partial [Rubricella sp.]